MSKKSVSSKQDSVDSNQSLERVKIVLDQNVRPLRGNVIVELGGEVIRLTLKMPVEIEKKYLARLKNIGVKVKVVEP